MDTVGVPGPLIYNIVRATWRFLCICLFLLFVVLIVLAFGDNYKISGTNQMLATLAGGFLPWVFRNILFKSKDALSLDTKNRACLVHL
jgi:predicted membrane channel-forming protein YqfA (hemolysin III family)